MARDKGHYKIFEYEDSLIPGLRLKIDYSVSLVRDKADISELITAPLEKLRELRDESVQMENVVYEKLHTVMNEWEEHAARTQTIDGAIQYLKAPEVPAHIQ